jgi:serine/threonine protein kinase
MPPVAIKKYNTVKNTDGLVPREITICNRLDHPNCLRLLDSFTGLNNAFVLVMPLAVHGSVKISNTPEITVSQAVLLLHDIGAALNHMHSKQIVHRDVKPGNILFMDDIYVLCDFSISSQLSKTGEMISGIAGTSLFMAPEISVMAYYPKPVDIWALGITVFGLLYGRYPWTLGRIFSLGTGTMNGQNAARAEINGDLEFPDVPFVPNEMKDIISRLLDRDWRTRMTANEVTEHPWLNEQANEWRNLLAFLADDADR